MDLGGVRYFYTNYFILAIITHQSFSQVLIMDLFGFTQTNAKTNIINHQDFGEKIGGARKDLNASQSTGKKATNFYELLEKAFSSQLSLDDCQPSIIINHMNKYAPITIKNMGDEHACTVVLQAMNEFNIKHGEYLTMSDVRMYAYYQLLWNNLGKTKPRVNSRSYTKKAVYISNFKDMLSLVGVFEPQQNFDKDSVSFLVPANVDSVLKLFNEYARNFIDKFDATSFFANVAFSKKVGFSSNVRANIYYGMNEIFEASLMFFANKKYDISSYSDRHFTSSETLAELLAIVDTLDKVGKYLALSQSCDKRVGGVKSANIGVTYTKSDFTIWKRKKPKHGELPIFISLNKKKDRLSYPLMEFDNTGQACEFLRDEFDELVKLATAYKAKLFNKTDLHLANSDDVRNGKDHRAGKDITTEQFANTFGFRAVEFGNWVNQGKDYHDRADLINKAYDAFCDLADFLGVEKTFIGLGGTLAIAFGSRGKGKASAHYERGFKVINLTKTRGNGTLAHEWFHAYDNYVGGATSFKSGNKAFMRDVLKLTSFEQMSQRAYRLDKAKGSDYFYTDVEMVARYFESVVSYGMRNFNQKSEFLVNYNSSVYVQNEFFPYVVDDEYNEQDCKEFLKLYGLCA